MFSTSEPEGAEYGAGIIWPAQGCPFWSEIFGSSFARFTNSDTGLYPGLVRFCGLLSPAFH